MSSKRKPILLSVLGLATFLAVSGFWYWSQRGPATQNEPSTRETTSEFFGVFSPADADETLGGQILGKLQNPFKGELPTVNPFEKAETNPLKDIYINPFE